MDGEASWWTTSGNIGLPPLARVMGVGRQQQLLIDNCCFIAMPLSRFSDTFNIPHTNGTFPHMFNVSNNYNYVRPLPALRYYDPNKMENPLRTQLIEWHKAHEKDVFDFAKEIHDFCKADVQLLKSGCIQFRKTFITDTGIDPFQSCTIAGACRNVLKSETKLHWTHSGKRLSLT